MNNFNYTKSISTKIFNAASYTFFGSFIARFCGIAISVLMARKLGSSALGLYVIVLSTVTMYSAIFDFGLSVTATKMMSQFYLKDLKKAGQILTLISVLFLLFIILGSLIYFLTIPLLVLNIYKINKILFPMEIAIVWFIFTSLNQFMEAILMGFHSFKKLMFISSFSNVINLLLVLLVIGLPFKNILLSFIIAGILLSLIQFIIYTLAICSEIKKHDISFSLLNIKTHLSPVFIDFSLPSYMGKLIEQPLSWLSILLLIKLGSDGVACVGGLQVLNNLKSWILYFPSTFVGVLIPIFTEVFHTRDKGVFFKTLFVNRKFLVLTTLPLVVLFVGIMRPALFCFFGSEYEAFYIPGIVLLAWTLLVPINEVNDRAMIAMGEMWRSLFFRIIYLIIFLILLILLIPRYNLLGYILAGGISYIIYVLFQANWLANIAKENNESLIRVIAFSLIFLLFSSFIAFNASVYKIIFFSFTLFIVVICFEWKILLTKEEKSMVFDKFNILLAKFNSILKRLHK